MALGALLYNGTEAFVQNNSFFSLQKQKQIISSELYIIGPMIRKMREEQAKKKMPMASEEERRDEAPGLRVGRGAWKWPPVWPYANNELYEKMRLLKLNPMATR